MSFLGERSSTVKDAKLQILYIVRIGAEQLLKDRTEKVRKNGINVRFVVGMGSPPDGIADMAKNENVDLIIMGSKVSEISDCPVMIVKH